MFAPTHRRVFGQSLHHAADPSPAQVKRWLFPLHEIACAPFRMERAAAQEVWEPDTGGCPKLLFPKLDPPCCWRKLPLFDGEVVDPFDGDVVNPPFDVGVAWLEVDPTACPATTPLSIPNATIEPAISHCLHLPTNVSSSALDRRSRLGLACIRVSSFICGLCTTTLFTYLEHTVRR